MPKPARTLSLVFLIMSFAAATFSQTNSPGRGLSAPVDVDRTVTAILVRSGDQGTLQILKRAFSAHGGYTLVDTMRNASFAIKVDPLGGAGARVQISSGVPEKTLFTESLAGENTRAAVLRAIDRAIFKTSGKPGFFSGKLAYVGEDSGFTEVYTSDLLFGNRVRRTSDSVEVIRPRWSPDGTYIVFTSYKSGFPDIHRLNVRTNRRDILMRMNGTNMGARYSPDGSRIAMVLTGGKNADVWTLEASGALRNLSRSDALEAAPSWSPDGGRLIFSSDARGNQLYVMSSQGGRMRRVPTNISGYCAEPDWNSVNANLIAFTAAMGSGSRAGYQIAIYDMSTGTSEFVTSESGDAIEAAWLNDGRHLIYTLKRANSRQIKILDTATGKTFPLSNPRSVASQASVLAP